MLSLYLCADVSIRQETVVVSTYTVIFEGFGVQLILGVYSSVQDTVEGAPPPKASAHFCNPAPARDCLAVIKAPPADHDVPSYSSVHDTEVGEFLHQKQLQHFVFQLLLVDILPLIRDPPADHDVPLYSSVHDTAAGALPPKASPSFCVPVPAKHCLPVIKAPPADHEVPLYSWVHDLLL
jgi:hypothetical protein